MSRLQKAHFCTNFAQVYCEDGLNSNGDCAVFFIKNSNQVH